MSDLSRLTPPQTQSQKHTVLGRVFGLCLAASLLWQMPAHAEADLIAGPMVGHTDTHSSRIWLQTDEAGKVQIEYWEMGSAEKKFSAEVSTGEKGWFTALLHLPDLKPEQAYEYRVYLDGQVIESKNVQRFKTPAFWQKGQAAPDFQIVMGSCYYINDDWMKLLGIEYGGPLQIFQVLEQEKADFMLWLGDNVYMSPLDVSNSWRMNSRYRLQRSQPIIQPLLAKMPQYAIWDDHDFGPNNSTAGFPLKAASLDLFKAYWANPRYGLATEPGNWSRLSWNDVDIFLTDGRYYRDAYDVPEEKRKLLGDAQLAWLKQELKASQAPFKLVVMGSPIFNPVYSESFAQYPSEYNDFFDFVQREKIEGLVFISGDRHHSDLYKEPVKNGYPFYNFTSSPLTSLPTQIMSAAEQNLPKRVPGTLVQQHNYGMLKFEGPPGKRVLIMETRDAKGKLLWEYRIQEQELRF